MKLIIDIPEMAYDAYKEWHKNKVATVEQSLIANGKPYEERPQGDLISREALKEEIRQEVIENRVGVFVAKRIIKLIDNAPTVEPTFKPIAEVKFDEEQLQEIVDKAKAEVLASVERPQGEWIEKEETPASVSYYCSVCKVEGIPITPFCPWCGAEMKGGAE